MFELLFGHPWVFCCVLFTVFQDSSDRAPVLSTAALPSPSAILSKPHPIDYDSGRDRHMKISLVFRLLFCFNHGKKKFSFRARYLVLIYTAKEARILRSIARFS